jgi:predicted nucleic acid-binding protein
MAKTTGIPIYYFDSCLLLAIINEEVGRFETVEAILEDAEKKECQVYTSQMSVAEVAFGDQEKKGKALSDAAQRKIEKLWHPSGPIQLVDVHSIIAVQSRELIRQAMKDGWTNGEDWSIKPPDAIHLATAKLVSAKHFFTYDDRLLKLKKTGLDIRKPFLKQGRIGMNPSP